MTLCKEIITLIIKYNTSIYASAARGQILTSYIYSDYDNNLQLCVPLNGSYLAALGRFNTYWYNWNNELPNWSPVTMPVNKTGYNYKRWRHCVYNFVSSEANKRLVDDQIRIPNWYWHYTPRIVRDTRIDKYVFA